MIATVLLLITLVALGQFAAYSWRAVMARVAAEPLSERVRVAAGLRGESIGSADFYPFLKLFDLTPRLKDRRGGLGMVRAYYGLIRALGRLVPGLAAWSEREMALCSRYVAVLVDQRLERNLACVAEIRAG